MTNQQSKRPSQQPFQVHVIDGGIYSGHTTASAAESVADRANKRAEQLGLDSRYEVRELEAA